MAKTHGERAAAYWDATADVYQAQNRISTTDFHYGPLLPGDAELGLLPPVRPGQTSLEVGCGGAQNSIFLARRGVQCVGCDVSARQLQHARRLAREAGVRMRFRRLSIDGVGTARLGTFDLVHSTYCLGYARDSAAAVRALADRVAPGGTILLVTHHPAYAGVSVEVDGGEEGVLISDYFRPRPHVQRSGRSGPRVSEALVPPPTVLNAVADAGLRLVRYLEPAPLPIDTMSEEEIAQRVPYDGDWWRELYPLLRRVPIAYIVVARRS